MMGCGCSVDGSAEEMCMRGLAEFDEVISRRWRNRIVPERAGG